MIHRFRLLLICLVTILAVAPSLSATWSIVVVDRATGEVAVAGATCIAGGSLKGGIATLKVGWGAGAAQAATSEKGRRVIGQELTRHTPPDQIMYLTTYWDKGLQGRQYGVVDMSGDALSFTGSKDAYWAGNRNGRVGSLSYAIQGNILVGEDVVDLAEEALIETPGPLCDKVMAAMNAAAKAGGDARCTQWRKSAHVAFMVVSRIGDSDGFCPFDVCIDGDYFLELDVSGTVGTDPDPVFVMTQMYQEWKARRIGRADHLASQVTFTPTTLYADGVSQAIMLIRLHDLLGKRITWGGAHISVVHDESSDGIAQIGSVEDNGDGSYSVPLTAGTRPGRDIFRVSILDGFPPGRPDEREVLLYPFPTLEEKTALRLYSTATRLKARRVQNVDFALQAPRAFGNRIYLLLATASGTEPGFELGTETIPLNIDPFLVQSFLMRNQAPFIDTLGLLDPSGRAAASFQPLQGQLDDLVGYTLNFAWLTIDPTNGVSNPVAVRISD